MDSVNDITYEFNITVVGTGKDVDSAFQDVLDTLKSDPMSIIRGEVVYVAESKEEVEADVCEEGTLDN